MKTVKRIVAVLLAVMLMAPAAVNAAAPSVTDTNINNKKAAATVTFNKKKQLPTTITVNGQKLVVGKDCIILKKKKSGKKNSGKYTLTIKGIGNYSGTTTVTYKIKKAEQPIKTAVASKTYDTDKVATKNKSFKLKPKAVRKHFTYVVKGKYVKDGTKASERKQAKKNAYARKYITVNKNGKVTVKKGIKKGTYRVVIKAKSTKNHKKGRKVVKIVIK